MIAADGTSSLPPLAHRVVLSGVRPDSTNFILQSVRK
jgi:hypothetical protein